MNKIFRLSVLMFITTTFYLKAFAQELPDDPILPPELVKQELNEADSKELFDVLNKWRLVVVDRQTQTKKIQTSDVVCVENMEDGRQLGCAVYDNLNSRDITKYNKNADPLFKVLLKHAPMDCDDESETCTLSAEKIFCTLTATKYACSLELLIPQPKKKKGD